VQHVVSSLENAGVLDGDEVIRPLNHTEGLAGSAFILTDSARVFICQIETDRTKPDLFFYVQDRSRQFLSLERTAPQNVEGQSGRRFFPYPRKPCQGFDQVVNGLGINSHR